MNSHVTSHTASHPAWSRGIRILHWLTAALLAYALWVAFFEMGPGLSTMTSLPTHITLGMGLLLLVVVRLVWRAIERHPRWDGNASVWVAARLVQAALYALLVAVIFTGWMAYRPMALMPPPKIAGLWPLPDFPARAWLPAWPYRALHQLLTWIFLAFTGLHIAAALLHAVRRDGTFGAMTFRWNR